CKYTYVDWNWLARADAFDFPFLKHPQKSNLNLCGQVADLVKENRATICRFKSPQSSLYRTSKGAFLMPKEFGRNQRLRDRGAVHTDECPLRAIGSVVDGTGDQFLTCTCFTQNQNRGIGRRHLGNLAKHLAQNFRRANDVPGHRVAIDLLS